MLHHGRGADELDLLGLADVLDPARRLHVVSPRAPLQPQGSPGYHWYLVAARRATPTRRPSQAAYAALAELHDELWERTGIGTGAHRPRRLLDGRRDELRARPRRRAAGARRDPRLLRLHARRSRAGSRSSPARAGLPVFISHGTRDPVISVEFAREAQPATARRAACRSPTTSSSARTTSTRASSRSRASGWRGRIAASAARESA